MSKKILILLGFVIVLNSCKTPRRITGSGEILKNASARLVLSKLKNTSEPKSFSAVSKVELNGKKISTKIRLKTDSIIWISGSFLGIPVAKAKITKDSILFYEKVKKTYAKESISNIRKILGFDITFSQLQDIFMGQKISIKNTKYSLKKKDKMYNLVSKPSKKHISHNVFVDANFVVKKQTLVSDGKMIKVGFDGFVSDKKYNIPKKIQIISKDKKLVLEYKKIDFDKKLKFPFKIPKGYRERVLK